MNQNPTNIIEDLRFLTEPHPMWWFIGVVTILLLAVLIYKLIQRQGKKTAQTIEEIQEQPFEDALAELEKLRTIMKKENSKEYAIRASGIVRRYIERRFGIVAPNRSTEEFLAEAHRSDALLRSHRELLGEFLASCDYLKFAKAFAEKEELEKLQENAVNFVKATWNGGGEVDIKMYKKSGQSDNGEKQGNSRGQEIGARI